MAGLAASTNHNDLNLDLNTVGWAWSALSVRAKAKTNLSLAAHGDPDLLVYARSLDRDKV